MNFHLIVSPSKDNDFFYILISANYHLSSGLVAQSVEQRLNEV